MKNILALLADWANGLFAVLLASYVTGVQPEWWYFLIGIILSHFPDIDALPELFRRGRVSASEDHPRDHRTVFHYPVLLIGFGWIMYLLIPYWGLVFLVVVSLHLVNDLYGTGWGIKLFWPLSNNNFKFGGRRANQLKGILVADGIWDSLSHSERRFRWLVSWNQDELPKYIIKFGIDEWIGRYYQRLNWICGVEYGLFTLAVILVALSLI